MIFSTDRCPLCNNKLEMQVISSLPKGKVAFLYYCEKREKIRNESDTGVAYSFHFEGRFFQGGEISIMNIQGYQLQHSKFHNRTVVYRTSTVEPKKILFDCPLLDIDYTKPHIVTDKLKMLVTFS